jgi:hypothetical protein
MAKKKGAPRSWTNAIERAARALSANKRRIESAAATGVGSDKILRARSYDPDPQGGGPVVPKQSPPPLQKTGRRQRKR